MNKDYYVQLNIQDDFDKHIGVVKLNETDSIVLNINLVQNGKPFDLSTSSYVTMGVIKPDGSFNNGYCEIVDGIAGKIKYTLPVNCVNQTGVFRGEVQAFNNTSMISTAAFSYEVKNSLLRDEGVTTQPEYPILVQLIDDVEAAVIAEAGRVTAEQGRVTAETVRVSAESARATAETDRTSAETTRVSQENTRKSQETSRVNAESARVTAESARVTAENARASAETTRQSNETARGSAETSRSSAENARATAETSRAQAESWRSSAETLRVNAENGRVSAESYRVSEFQQILDEWDAIQEADVRAEVVAARASAKLGITYPNLDGRLEFIESEVFAGAELPLTLGPSNQVKSITDSTDGIADVEVGGATLNNSLTNGDFANGTTGWTPTSATHSVTSKVYSLTGNGGSANPYSVKTTLLNIKNLDKVFVKSRVRVTNANCITLITRLAYPNTSSIGEVAISTPVQNQWYDTYFIATMGTVQSGLASVLVQHKYADAATANGKVMEVDGNVGVFAVNLTALGLDSLTADQCNYMINKYFEGFAGSNELTLESVGRNLFNEQGDLKSKPTYATSTFKDTFFDGEKVVTKGVIGIDFGTGQKIKVKANTQYSLSMFAVGTTQRVVVHDINRNELASAQAIAESTASVTFTSPLNGLIWISFQTNSSSGEYGIKNLMLKEGTTGTYQAYKGRKLTVKGITRHKLPNGVQDWFMQKRGYTWATKNIFSDSDGKGYALKIADLTGVADLTNVTIVATKNNLFTNNSPWTDAVNQKTLVGDMKEIALADRDNTANIGTYYTNANQAIVFVMTKGTTLAQAQAELVTNKQTKILYQLAAPQYIPFEDFGANGIEVLGSVPTFNDYTHLALTSADITPTVDLDYQGNISAAVVALKEVSANNLEQIQKHEKRLDYLKSGAETVASWSGFKIYKTIAELGLTGTPTAVQIATAMPNNSVFLGEIVGNANMPYTNTALELKRVDGQKITAIAFDTDVQAATSLQMSVGMINLGNATQFTGWLDVYHSGRYGKPQSKSSSFTLALADCNTCVDMTGAATQTVTVPNDSAANLPDGTQIVFEQVGAGLVTFANAAGVTVRSKNGYRTIDGQYAQAVLTKKGPNLWNLTGLLKA